MNPIVLETNVLVSGFLSPFGPPGKIVDWLRPGSVTLVVNEQIVAEYRDVLRRPEFDLPIDDVEYVINTIIMSAE